MLTPTVANRISWLYAAGSTPATNLARDVPHGQDADLLSLGCGDIRNILFTSYNQIGLPARKLDITCCDVDEKVIGRNFILLSLALEETETKADTLWDIYYNWHLDDVNASCLVQHVQAILRDLESLDSWNASKVGSRLKMGDDGTFQDVRKVLLRVISASTTWSQDEHNAKFVKSLDMSKSCIKNLDTVLTGLRSAAPLSMKSTTEMPKKFKQYWTEGTVFVEEESQPTLPNPMFAGLLSDDEILYYGTDPLLGFHLATAFADLTEHSPLKFETKEGVNRIATAAKTQFSEWIRAFRTIRDQITIRFVVSDVFSLCHTLQNAAASGKTSANWYKRQWDSRILQLSEPMYGNGGTAPVEFDAIHTSNLSDQLGALNLAISAAPLLKEAPWATLHTDHLMKQDDSEKQSLDDLLCGPSSTVSLLLGLTPLQYWTNAKIDSHVDELFIGLLGKNKGSNNIQLYSRLVWKRDNMFLGRGLSLPKLHIEVAVIAKTLLGIYLQMFSVEKRPTDRTATATKGHLKGLSRHLHFHRGSFVALLKLIQSRVKTDWPAVFLTLLDMISRDRTLILASNQMQEFCIQLHLCGIHTESWVYDQVKDIPTAGPFKGWRNVPPAVAVTVRIPRMSLEALQKQSEEVDLAAPVLIASLRSNLTSSNQWHNIYTNVHIVFGKITVGQDQKTGDKILDVQQDDHGWSGNSPLIASFMVPTAAILVDPLTATVGLDLSPIGPDNVKYQAKLGVSMKIFGTELRDESRVFISKLMPGQSANTVVCGGIKMLQETIPRTDGEGPTKFVADFSPDGVKLVTLTGHMTICSETGKQLLKDSTPIEIQQEDPSTLNIVFGQKDLVCPLRFPAPVTKTGSKTRIARKSGYIEVIAPLAIPVRNDILNDFILPSVLAPKGLPVVLNAPYINLDSLPILDTSKEADLKWLTTLTSLQFSVRERRIRQAAEENHWNSDDARVNFKESLFSMFMLSSGLQGGRTGLFAISNPQNGHIHMLIIVSALRLDSDTASVVLDAAAIPVTRHMIDSVNDVELRLWKKMLPSFVERCRSWDHGPACEYKAKGASVPISMESGGKPVCSCGNGKFPDEFVTIPEWDTVQGDAVRIAISPLFAVPYVEDVVDKKVLSLPGEVPRCRNCGKEGRRGLTDLYKCMRCEQVKYCSVDCQRADWKKHRPECV